MIDIEKIKPEILDRLKPLSLDKVILFGSYAYGTPNNDSDVDLFLLKDNVDDLDYDVEAQFKLGDLMKKYQIGFDILYSSSSFLNSSNEPFYKVDILEKGKVLYAK
ncbi:MAG: nucleotidyltransferase domain-containing protein [Campylobacterota bacterium]|nr:nucleotidyltransferase domain-containing protein [Campylobacterota bacterium]